MTNPTSNYGWQMPTATDLVTDLPADFEVFGQAVDTALADLKGGTTGQILSKASNTDMDFIWTSANPGDITGVTATSPLTGGGTSGDVTVGIQSASTSQSGAVQLSDSTSTTSSVLAATSTAVKSAYDLANGAIPKSLIDAAGDLIVGTANDTAGRIAIGSNGTVLTSNGTTATWAAATTGMTSLASGTLSGASVVLSSISGSYVHLQLMISNFKPATDGATFFLRVNADSGANRYFNGVVGSSSFTFNSTGWQVSQPQGNASDNGTIVVDLYNYTKTGIWKTAQSIATTDSGGTNYYSNQTLIFNQTGAITGLTMLPSGGNFTSGNYTLYGVK